MIDKENYLAEAQRQLSDERFYQKIDSDPTDDFSNIITTTLNTMLKNNEIGNNVYSTLLPTKLSFI